MRRFPKIITIFALLIVVTVLSLVPVNVAKAQATEPWAGLLYSDPDFQNLEWIVSYGDVGININWGTGAPEDPLFPGFVLSGLPVDNFSARFSTNWPFDAGIYEFTVIADGGARLSVENNVLFDQLDNRGLASFTGIAFVGSGPAHLALDYVDYAGDAILQITWVDITDAVQSPEPEIIQSGVATAQVTGVDGLALRSGPYLGASLVAVLRPGNTYTVTAQNNIEGTYTWYQLVVNPAGQTGWASGRYLEVDLQSVTERTCSLQPGTELTIAGQFVPGFSDAGLAIQCLSAAADVLNTSIAGEVTAEELLNVTVDCGSLLLSGTAAGQVLAFIDDARLALAISNVCNTGGCTISDTLALELVAALAPGSAATTFDVVICMNSIFDVLDGNVSIASASSLATSCAGLLLGNIAISGILNFLDLVAGNICTETSVPTIALPEQSSVFENLTLLPDTGVTLAPRSVMNIRVRPSTRVATVGQLPWGAEAQLIGRTIEAGEDHWYLIRYAGIIGWIDASFANVRGNINDVPIF